MRGELAGLRLLTALTRLELKYRAPIDGDGPLLRMHAGRTARRENTAVPRPATHLAEEKVMITTLGPRRISWRDTKGGSGLITILIEGLPDYVVDLGDGVTSRSLKAQVHISSSWQDRVMFAIGEDDLQVLFRLLPFTSLYLTQVCEDNDIELTDFNTPLNVSTDFAVFRSTFIN